MLRRIAASHPDRGGRQVQRPGSPGAEGLSGGDRSHARPGEAPGRRRRRRGSQSERPGCGHRGRWEKVGRHACQMMTLQDCVPKREMFRLTGLDRQTFLGIILCGHSAHYHSRLWRVPVNAPSPSVTVTTSQDERTRVGPRPRLPLPEAQAEARAHQPSPEKSRVTIDRPGMNVLAAIILRGQNERDERCPRASRASGC